MLNMTKSKYTNEEIFGGIAIAFVVVIAGYFMYKYYEEKKEEDSSGGKFCDSSGNAFTAHVKKACNSCMMSANGDSAAVDKCEAKATEAAADVAICVKATKGDSTNCDKCVADAKGDTAAIAKCSQQTIESFTTMATNLVQRPQQPFGVNSAVKCLENSSAKDMVADTSAKAAINCLDHGAAKYGRHA